jgi:hypothetical protein
VHGAQLSPEWRAAIIPIASDNTYYVSSGFASITAFALKSILTDCGRCFLVSVTLGVVSLGKGDMRSIYQHG